MTGRLMTSPPGPRRDVHPLGVGVLIGHTGVSAAGRRVEVEVGVGGGYWPGNGAPSLWMPRPRVSSEK